MKKPEISVIIAARNAEEFIKTCLDSILKEQSSEYEVIVVDDCSDDNSVKILEKYARKNKIILFTFPVKKGAAAARNFATTKSRGTYLFFLDSDTEAEPGWSDNITRFYKKDPDSIMICKLLRFHSNRFDSAGEYLSPHYLLIDRAKAAINTGQFEKPEKVFSGKSAAMIIPKRQFIELGGFDEHMEWLLEDTDLCWRNQLAGFDVLYQPEITVFHNDPTYGKTKKYYNNLQPKYRGCRNTIRTVLKNVEGKRLWYAVPVQIFIWLSLSLMMMFRGNFKIAGELFSGIWWNIQHIEDTWQKRQIIQKSRTVTDKELLKEVGITEPLTHYFDKAIRYVKG